MNEYHKIQTVYKRDPETKHKTLLIGEYSLSEFEYLKDNTWVFTEKVDGTNIRVIFDGEYLSFGGRTNRAQIPADLVNVLNTMFRDKLELFNNHFSDGVVLYGEGYGAKIQKGGGNYRPDQGFVLFDVKIGDYWLEENNMLGVAEIFNLKVIPEIGRGTLEEMVKITRDGFSSRWGDFQAEGIVARPETELKTRSGHRIITKIKCRDFK